MINIFKCVKKWLYYKHVAVAVVGKDKRMFKHLIMEKSQEVNDSKKKPTNPADLINSTTNVISVPSISSKSKYVGYTHNVYYKIYELHRHTRWNRFHRACGYFVGVICEQTGIDSRPTAQNATTRSPVASLNSNASSSDLTSSGSIDSTGDLSHEIFEASVKNFILQSEQIIQGSKPIYLITDNPMLAIKVIQEHQLSQFQIIYIYDKDKIKHTFR